nr:MAG TPA: MazG C-terminal domain [Caudoviricetes sp.]
MYCQLTIFTKIYTKTWLLIIHLAYAKCLGFNPAPS